MHQSTASRRHDPRYPALGPQRNICHRLGPAPKHQLDQRPGRAEQRQFEIPLWQDTNVRPLILDVLCDPNGDGAGSGKITLEAGEDLA